MLPYSQQHPAGLQEHGHMTPHIKNKVATLEAGAQWGHLYAEFIYGGHDGYMSNGGRCPGVGVSSFILGGGLSLFTRSFGMDCDTLKEATIVTAAGDAVAVLESEDPNPEKGQLVWAPAVLAKPILA